MAEKESKLLIFDFDGTIVNSKAVYYHAIEKYLNKKGFSKETADKAIDIGLSLTETLKNLGIPFVTRFFVKRQIMFEVLDGVNKVKKCKDANHIIQLKQKKILISNSLSEFIMPVLKHLKLKDEFDEIYGAEAFDNKTDFVKEYLYRNSINPKNCFYIGDRVADVKLAKAVKCKSIIVSNETSWNTRKEITKASPDFIISDLDDVKKIVDPKN